MALDEICRVQGLMRLLMKPRNGRKWSAEDRAALRGYLRHAARTLPVLGLFSLPLGGLALPLLAFFLDRRRHRSRPTREGALQEGEQVHPG